MENRATFITLIGALSHSWSPPWLAGDRVCRSVPRRICGAIPLAGLMLGVAWSAPTMADTAMQTYELDLKRCSADMPLPDGSTDCDLEPYYVACLDEYLVGEYHVVGKHQEFETSAGTAHLRDNWKIISMFFGVTTGRAWYAVGVSPASANFAGASTFFASGTLTYKPLAEGPTWQEQFVYMQDPHDETRVKMDKSSYKCLGSGQ